MMAPNPFRERQRLRWQQSEAGRLTTPLSRPSRLAALWQRGNSVWKLLAGLSGTVSVAIFTVVLIAGVMNKALVIQPLAVPKPVADAGFTAEIAALRLRDAIESLVKDADTSRQHRAVLPQAEELNVVIPAFGLPIQMIATPIRAWLGLKQHLVISGEVTVEGGQLALTLRQDGHLIYTSPTGVDPAHPAALMGAAAREVLRNTEPYIFASYIFQTDKPAALRLAGAIIARLPPKDPDALYARNLVALVHNASGRLDDAIQEQQALIRLDRRNPLWRRNLGVFYRESGRTKLAQAIFEKITRIDGTYAMAHVELGNFLKEANRDDQARAEYLRAIALDPNDFETYYNLGVLEYDHGRYKEAATAYETAIALKPNYGDAVNNLGVVLDKLGLLDQAIEELRTAVTLEPNNAEAYVNLAITLRVANKRPDALAAFRRAIELDPKNASAHASVGLLLFDQPEAARTEYEQAIALNPSDARFHSGLGAVLRRLGQLAPAADQLRRAIELQPNDAISHTNLAMVLAGQSKREDAMAEYKRAIELAPGDLATNFNLAVLLANMGRREDAVAQYRKAAQVAPDDSRPHRALADLLPQLGRIPEARDEDRIATDLDLAAFLASPRR